jgi:hypothetical protein
MSRTRAWNSRRELVLPGHSWNNNLDSFWRIWVALKRAVGGKCQQVKLNSLLLLDAKTVNVHLKLSLRAGVKNKSLKQSKGTGASGSLFVLIRNR